MARNGEIGSLGSRNARRALYAGSQLGGRSTVFMVPSCLRIMIEKWQSGATSRTVAGPSPVD
jgi:hypothetical protein